MEREKSSEAVLKVLVVDDEEDIRELVGMNLKRQGFAVAVAGDGISALAVAKTSPRRSTPHSSAGFLSTARSSTVATPASRPSSVPVQQPTRYVRLPTT